MCGIAGYVHRDRSRPADAALLARMVETLRHRGPDDDGYLCEGPVGLAMRRLQVLDLEGGAQPLYNEDRTVAVVFNGEIYNFRELRQDLEARGHTFRTRCDTEVIVHQYEEDGVDCLRHFDGMFALALWDSRRRRLLLARDRMGIKPLHWMDGNTSLVFASELKALLPHPDATVELDPVGLSRYLTHEYLPAPHTILRGMNKLPPGHRLLLDDSGIRVERWWRVRFHAGSVPGRREDALHELESRVENAVRNRLMSDVPLGAFLSGGVDSSTVVAMMQRHSTRPVKTFSIGFHESSYDESPYARQVAHHLGTEHHEKIFHGREMLDLIPQVADFLDEPLGDASILPTFLLSRFTRQDVTVALSGDGGDELFGGYPTYRAHRTAHWYRQLPRLLRRAVIEPLVRALPVSDSYLSLDFVANRFIAAAALPPLERHVTWMGSLLGDDKRRILSADLRRQLDGDDELSSARQVWDECDTDDPLGRLLHLDMRTYLQDDILTKVDRAGMAHSLEVRVPLLDHHVVEFAAALPSKWKLHGRQSKVLFKQLAARWLPPSIVQRPKRGFAIPVASWLRGPLREMVADLLAPQRIRRQGLFDPEGVQTLLREHLERKANHRKPLFTLLMFQLWHERWATTR